MGEGEEGEEGKWEEPRDQRGGNQYEYSTMTSILSDLL